MSEHSVSSLFLTHTREYLGSTYPDRLAQALGALPAGDLWWSPHPGALTVGTILLHLEGNVRQWILAGLRGEPDNRQRSLEFTAPSEETPRDEREGERAALLDRLQATTQSAVEVIENLDGQSLETELVVQGFEVTRLEVLYHVVEHFSWHVGQAIWIAKARGGPDHGVALYDEDQVNRGRNG